MTGQTNGPHLYGTPDPNNPEPVSKGGMRGERSGDQEPGTPALERQQRVDGRAVTIEETSGSVYAEESGQAGKDERGSGDR